MMTTKRIRVFVASPSDVQRERDSLLGVINELNRTCDYLLGYAKLRLELVRWETDTFPDAGRTQALINEQIGDYDIFIGILWTRIGTPTGEEESGTIEEFEIAYEKWQKNKKPHICFYFNRAPKTPPRSVEEAKQVLGVAKFRKKLDPIVYLKEYDGATIFADTIRPHLAQLIGTHFLGVKESAAVVKTGKRVAAFTQQRHGTLSAIGPQDACYTQQSKYIGHAGVIIEAEEQDGWLRGTFRFEKPLFEGDNRIYSFLQFKVEN